MSSPFFFRDYSICFTLLLTQLAVLGGCASKSPASSPQPYRLHAEGVTYGKPHTGMDRTERAIKWPLKLIPFVKKNEWRNEPAAETTDRVLDYLEKNELQDTEVFVHHYDPAQQWRRLAANKQMSPFYRYTFGTGSLMKYTLFPGRVLGWSEYNPYTNSLYANSEGMAPLMAEVAKAKDIRSRNFPGTYASATCFPGINLVPHYRSVNEVVDHAQEEGDWELEREAYQKLYSRAGSKTLTTFIDPVPVAWWVSPVADMTGGAIGSGLGTQEAQKRAQELRDITLSQTSPSQKETSPTIPDPDVEQASFRTYRLPSAE